MDRITRTCSIALAAALLVPSAADAKKTAALGQQSMLATYARARLAGSDGALDKASQAYSAVLAVRPDDASIAARAYRQALVAGDIP